jgi:uncharacterized protein (DUF1778 family)
MSTTTTRSSRSKRKSTGGSLMVRLDGESKRYLARAAELRRVSMSDYIRLVTISQARREVQEAEHNTIRLTADEQLAFWKALQAPVKLTKAQRELGRLMRGEE